MTGGHLHGKKLSKDRSAPVETEADFALFRKKLIGASLNKEENAMCAGMPEVRVRSVKPLDDMMILTFTSGERRLYGLRPTFCVNPQIMQKEK